MATVRKCDICGKVYGEYPKADETIMLMHTMKRQDWSSSVYSKDEFDCCPKCTEKVLGFIDVLKNYPDNHCITVFDKEDHDVD